ncbi:hypothetical protein BpHYR1_017674 [Brachionus plicatilis]|uniref:Uncharacterized protein n=1 Tax=Brachionus plicatilis TaxID=10195 RepID=A0A3M7QQQ3_BRAPC|nr:hypothetical protein BpHYR1_017674 [Brachionus plicatilis]
MLKQQKLTMDFSGQKSKKSHFDSLVLLHKCLYNSSSAYISRNINNEIWELSTGSCQYWKKNLICKHRPSKKGSTGSREKYDCSFKCANFRSIQANIEPSIQTQSARTSNQILSIGGNNQLLENQNGQTVKHVCGSPYEQSQDASTLVSSSDSSFAPKPPPGVYIKKGFKKPPGVLVAETKHDSLID